MDNKYYNYFFWFVVCCLSMFINSCSIDEEYVQKDRVSRIKKSYISFYELQQRLNSKPLFKRFENKFDIKSSAINSSFYRNGDEFIQEIKTDRIIEMIKENGDKSYTMRVITNDENPNETTNLILKEIGDSLTSQIFRYKVYDKNNLNINGNLNGEIEYLNEQGQRLASNIESLNTGDCDINVYIEWTCAADNPHEPGHPNCNAGGNYISYILITVDCGQSDSGGGNTGGTGPPVGGGPDLGGGVGSGGGPDSNPINPEEGSDDTATEPIFDIWDGEDNPNNPCDQLKKLFQTDSIQPNKAPNLKPDLEILRGYADSNINHEKAYEFYKNSLADYSTSSIISGVTTNSVNITIPNPILYGAAHTHSVNLYSMFSWSDVYTLYRLYGNATMGNKNECVFMLVSKYCVTCTEVNVYAIKINDFNKFRARLNADINNPRTYGYTLQQKIDFADEQFKEKFTNEMSQQQMEAMFLQNFANSGIALFKANENLDNWNELSLSSNPSMPITETPCN